MNNAKTKFVVAITQRLAAAPDSDAKLELIEELSENLFSRYQDLTASGVPEHEAYEKALGELGDVSELVAYLNGLGPAGEAPRQDGDFMSDLLHDIGGLVQEAVVQAKDAANDAAAMVRDAADQFRQYHAERGAPAGPEEGGTLEFSSEAVRAIDVTLTSGDTAVSFDPDPSAPVRLMGDTEELQVRTDGNGVLTIRQGTLLNGSFSLLRALRSVDIRLILPRRSWESLSITTASGDVDIAAGLTAQRLSVKTASGDLELEHADCGEILFQSASGDFDAENISGAVRAETMSGDISVRGSLRALRCSTASGDVEARTDALPEQLDLSSKSGDCEAVLPGDEGFTVQFRTVSGDLFCGFPLTGPMGGRSGEAVYLDGGSRTFRLSSVSGDLSLRMR